MPTYNASDMSSNAQVQALHAGLNQRTVEHTLHNTLTASSTINMGRLVQGSQVVGGLVRSNADYGDMTVRITDSLGNVYMESASLSNGAPLDGRNLGTRITGSAHLQATMTGTLNTGTASLWIAIDLLYKTEERGD